MQVQTNKVGIFGRPGQFRWVAAYSGFPNSNGVGETKEEAIAQLEQIKCDRPWEFAPSEFIHTGDNEWFYLQQWPEHLKAHAIERLVNNPELQEAIARMTQAQIAACVRTAMMAMGVAA